MAGRGGVAAAAVFVVVIVVGFVFVCSLFHAQRDSFDCFTHTETRSIVSHMIERLVRLFHTHRDSFDCFTQRDLFDCFTQRETRSIVSHTERLV